MLGVVVYVCEYSTAMEKDRQIKDRSIYFAKLTQGRREKDHVTNKNLIFVSI
jgi:hypothetical protein